MLTRGIEGKTKDVELLTCSENKSWMVKTVEANSVVRD